MKILQHAVIRSKRAGRVVPIQENLTNRQERGEVTGNNKTDDEEDSFVRFELPLIITGWIVVLITYGYLLYSGM